MLLQFIQLHHIILRNKIVIIDRTVVIIHIAYNYDPLLVQIFVIQNFVPCSSVLKEMLIHPVIFTHWVRGQNNVVAECWVAETTKDLLESRIFNLGTLLDPDNRYAI